MRERAMAGLLRLKRAAPCVDVAASLCGHSQDLLRKLACRGQDQPLRRLGCPGICTISHGGGQVQCKCGWILHGLHLCTHAGELSVR